MSPYKNKALIWDQYTQIHIYNISNGALALDYIYNASIIGSSDRTTAIHFSADGELALIEVDNKGDVRVLNLTDYSVTDSFSTGSGRIDGAVFLDAQSRFIYIQKSSGSNQVYDTTTSTLVDFTGSIGIYPRADPYSSQLYDI